MFNSNTQPKRIVKQVEREDWDCYSCDSLIKHYYSKCPTCGSRRDQGDSYRKGGMNNGDHGD